MAALAILLAFVLGALAWAGAATTVTRAIPTVEAVFPVLILVYFPVIIVSGALFRISEPSWLSTLATYLPAQPLIDAVTSAVRHTTGAPFLPTHDVVVLACWAVSGLAAVVVLFRWEPHHPTGRRRARTGQARPS